MNRKSITAMLSMLVLVAGCVAIHPEVDSRAGDAVTAQFHEWRDALASKAKEVA